MRKLLSTEELNYITTYLLERFEFDLKKFTNVNFYWAKKAVWMMSNDYIKEMDKILAIDSFGFKILSGNLFRDEPLKPTTRFVQTYHQLFLKNNIELTRDELISFINREKIFLNDHIAQSTRGYVVVSYKKMNVGVAFYQNHSLTSHFPTNLIAYFHSDSLLN